MGHSIYLANLVEEAAKPEWRTRGEEGEPDGFDVDGFIASHLNFSGRGFDVVVFWDTADYLPEPLLRPLLERIHQVMVPEGQMLAMFHATSGGGNTDFCRYQMSDSDSLLMQRAGDYPLLQVYSNRQTESLLASFKSFHFFLGKDNVREVLVTR
jgi:hypothetical protein